MEGTVNADVSAPTLEQIAELAHQLPREQQEKLIERLTHDLHGNAPPRKGKGFRGIWRARFPEDIELDECLRLIRDESKRELEEIS